MHNSLCRLPIMNYLFFLPGEKLFICKLHEGDFGQHRDKVLTQGLSVMTGTL